MTGFNITGQIPEGAPAPNWDVEVEIVELSTEQLARQEQDAQKLAQDAELANAELAVRLAESEAAFKKKTIGNHGDPEAANRAENPPVPFGPEDNSNVTFDNVGDPFLRDNPVEIEYEPPRDFIVRNPLATE